MYMCLCTGDGLISWCSERPVECDEELLGMAQLYQIQSGEFQSCDWY